MAYYLVLMFPCLHLQLVTNWMDFEAATVDRAVALTMHMGENGPIRVNLDSPEEGLACLGVEGA